MGNGYLREGGLRRFGWGVRGMYVRERDMVNREVAQVQTLVCWTSVDV